MTEFKAKEYRLLYIVLFINGEQESLASLVLLAIGQGPVVRKVDNAIHWMNLQPVDAIILISLILVLWILIYLVDCATQHLNNQAQVFKRLTVLSYVKYSNAKTP